MFINLRLSFLFLFFVLAQKDGQYHYVILVFLYELFLVVLEKADILKGWPAYKQWAGTF